MSAAFKIRKGGRHTRWWGVYSTDPLFQKPIETANTWPQALSAVAFFTSPNPNEHPAYILWRGWHKFLLGDDEMWGLGWKCLRCERDTGEPSITPLPWHHTQWHMKREIDRRLAQLDADNRSLFDKIMAWRVRGPQMVDLVPVPRQPTWGWLGENPFGVRRG